MLWAETSFEGIEVTEGVQRLTKTETHPFIDLYKGKPTTARVYFTQPEGEAPGPHSPILRGLVDGVELSDSPLLTMRGSGGPAASRMVGTTSMTCKKSLARSTSRSQKVFLAR